MRLLVAVALLAASPALAAPGRVAGSKHDLSVTGPGPIKAEQETRVCIFCHVPHQGSREALSSRPDPGAGHRPYASGTMRARPGAPSGASRVCLSCHDGTIAIGRTTSELIAMNGAAPGGVIPSTRRSNLGTDLRRTHPISFAPAPAASTHRPAPHDAVRLDRNGELQCTACHDPHAEYGGSAEGKFLVKPTAGAQLCATCHVSSGASSHASSPAALPPAERAATGYASVAEAACMACHRSHGGDARGGLVARGDVERDDALCLRCHGGAVARLDVALDAAKPYSHAIDGGRQHDAAEGPSGPGPRLPETSAAAPRHAVCVDCHDPHEANGQRTAAPLAGGALAGVWGIDLAGRPVTPARFQYEVCFKCHADSANQADAPGAVRRARPEPNLRLVFDPSAPSFHPVAAPGRNPEVPGLLPPYDETSLVYCTDCHASSSGPGAGGSGPRGPHGSVYPHLLERSYSTADGTVESAAAYALCYKCHDREVLLSSRSAFPHRRHVVDGRAACAACHAAHGVARTSGTDTANAHLVDFDLSVVGPGPGGRREYERRGPRTGSCALRCHGREHDRTTY
ncbi:cytochrome c3 family protein [Anaeromyxobacter terrae]|uniref:cytochrome c3 family protein n=1 Tax=Anaeromyxobacter terrae TaxID=2925406 RepID=UPI001F569432|nr:cytochrome c3 family protein [Anaeromyxobacter sp. SG22]